jgi:acetone carboxylase gamma subunit
MRIHECLDIVEERGSHSIACRKCRQDLGAADSNFKSASLFRVTPKDDLTALPPPGGRHSKGVYVEYFCPGCGTLLDVEVSCPSAEGGKIEPIWDIEISMDAIRHASELGKASIAAE